jgi:orotidine-5'-phosphate decarboxylase
MTITFTDRLISAIKTKKSILCVGIDPQLNHLPPHLIEKYKGMDNVLYQVFEDYGWRIVEAVAPHAVAVKPNLAFFERHGYQGYAAYESIVEHAREFGLLVITDGKRGDGGDTADAYAEGYLGRTKDEDKSGIQKDQNPFRPDALTINGYIGDDCVTRFTREMKLHGTGAFVVTKTSFKPNSRIEQLLTSRGTKVWEEMAKCVDEWGNGTEGEAGWKNLGAVIGATYQEETIKARQLLPNSFFLVPGYGAQGGGAKAAVLGADKDGLGIIVNSSRGITNAWNDQHTGFKTEPENFAEAIELAARKACLELNMALTDAGKDQILL